ncbi:Regulator of RpoS [compost metagenome]
MPNVMGNGERVLYVDDDVVMALMVERLLKRARFDVSVVHEPNVASILLKERPDAYDVLVTDYNMPGLSGLELIQAARVIRPDLPAILISGYVSEELRELCQRQNVGVVLEKQKSLDELTAAIERCLEGTR